MREANGIIPFAKHKASHKTSPKKKETCLNNAQRRALIMLMRHTEYIQQQNISDSFPF